MSRVGRRLDRVFEERARAAPERVALSTPDGDVTYAELDARAERVAQRLRELGVGPNVLVGLCADRSVEMIIGLLGIVKAGGAYVPIDPDYPARRVRLLVEDSAVPAVVSVRRVAAALGDCAAARVWVDDEASWTQPAAAATRAPATPSEGDLAYIIYTSGSTGTPKGVMIEHHSVVRLLEQTQPWFHFDERDVWSVFHSIGFDFSVWEIWGALLYGGRMVIVPDEARRSPELLYETLRTQRVTVLNQTPSAFRQLLSALPPGDASELALRYVIFGGERLDVRLLAPWIERYGDERPELINMYGITETTVHVTYRRIRRDDLARPELSPIGVPIPDLEVHLWDASGEPVTSGSPGEMHVAGPGLARGYLNRPELTAERFVQRDPGDGRGVRRFYCSGDRAVRLADGQLAYLGRADAQIKVRGFRIEPREIEVCLAAEPGAGTVLVAPHDYGEGDVRLVAWVTPRPGHELTRERAEELTAALLRRARAELPPHMRPSAFHVVAAVPMTAHGKVDFEALRGLVEPARAPEDAPPAALTPTARLILQIAQDVLEHQAVGIHDDLFDLGATSLAFTRIVLRVNQRLGVTLLGSGLSEISVAALAAAAEAQIEAGAEAPDRAAASRSHPAR
jgi:amino acid adenylation domain-containing protein